MPEQEDIAVAATDSSVLTPEPVHICRDGHRPDADLRVAEVNPLLDNITDLQLCRRARERDAHVERQVIIEIPAYQTVSKERLGHSKQVKRIHRLVILGHQSSHFIAVLNPE